MSKALIDILNTSQARQFVREHLNDDPTALILKGANAHLPIKQLAAQIQSRNKARLKLPEWFANEEVIFPHGISMEQCSSEATALYKASLVHGHIVTDLTGGFGIDLAYLSKSFDQANYVEQSDDLVVLASHNFDKIGLFNINRYATKAEQYLDQETDPADLYYIDPARRSDTNHKVFHIEDCTPNLHLILPKILERKAEVLIKLSPLLDIHQALKVLPNVSEVHVLSVRNECKELLFRITHDHQGPPIRKTVNILSDHTELFEFTESDEQSSPEYGMPDKYLYEPNASIMKAGGFHSIARQFPLKKLHRNSHLYTAQRLVHDFPGRVFEINHLTVLNKKKIKPFLPEEKANITVRNYPMTVAQIRQKSGIREGGNIYLFATTLMDQQLKILVCSKAI